MISLEEKYPAHADIGKFVELLKLSEPVSGAVDIRTLNAEFNQLLEENRLQAAKIERYERSLREIKVLVDRNMFGDLSAIYVTADQAFNNKD